jgi:hypothetical protein
MRFIWVPLLAVWCALFVWVGSTMGDNDQPTLRIVPGEDGQCHIHMEPGLQVTAECLDAP